jgi:hypothetical protein
MTELELILLPLHRRGLTLSSWKACHWTCFRPCSQGETFSSIGHSEESSFRPCSQGRDKVLQAALCSSLPFVPPRRGRDSASGIFEMYRKLLSPHPGRD